MGGNSVDLSNPDLMSFDPDMAKKKLLAFKAQFGPPVVWTPKLVKGTPHRVQIRWGALVGYPKKMECIQAARRPWDV